MGYGWCMGGVWVYRECWGVMYMYIPVWVFIPYTPTPHTTYTFISPSTPIATYTITLYMNLQKLLLYYTEIRYILVNIHCFFNLCKLQSVLLEFYHITISSL